MSQNRQHKSTGQLIWAVALIIVGLGVFIRTPQVMPKLIQAGQSVNAMWFKVCIYLIGILLIGGGVKKIIYYFQPPGPEASDKTDEITKP